MGIVWEAYHKGPIIGGPWKSHWSSSSSNWSMTFFCSAWKSETPHTLQTQGTLNDISRTGHTPLAHAILAVNQIRVKWVWICNYIAILWEVLLGAFGKKNTISERICCNYYRSKSSYMWVSCNWQPSETGSHRMWESPMTSSGHQDMRVRTKINNYIIISMLYQYILLSKGESPMPYLSRLFCGGQLHLIAVCW